MYYRKIEGDKIYLSPMDKNNEIPLLTKWFNEDESIAYNNGFISSISNEENISETVDKWNESGMIFSIINKETDEFMGHVSFFGADNNKTFITMGIYIAEEYRGNGYGLETIKLSTEYMLDSMSTDQSIWRYSPIMREPIDCIRKLALKSVEDFIIQGTLTANFMISFSWKC